LIIVQPPPRRRRTRTTTRCCTSSYDLYLRPIADGAVIWTAPTGKTYTTHPGSRLLLSTWHASTTAPSALTRTPAAAVLTFGNRGAMMPQRRRTRAAETARRIRAERALNEALVAERNKPPPF
jgi:hypothetical protein